MAMLEEVTIDRDGGLIIKRKGWNKEQFCPFGRELDRCGDWCPFFREPVKHNDADLFVLELCRGRKLYFIEDDFIDERL